MSARCGLLRSRTPESEIVVNAAQLMHPLGKPGTAVSSLLPTGPDSPTVQVGGVSA